MKRTTIGIVVVILATVLAAYGLVRLGEHTSLVSSPIASVNRAALARRATLTVTGVGEVEVDPDVARVQFGVESKAETAQEAQAVNNIIMAQIIEALHRLGIEDKDIRTQYFSLYPQYNYDRESGEQFLIGYRAVNEVEVQVKDIHRLGEVIDAAINAGANRIQNVTYGVQNDTEYANAALEAAIQNAVEKANVMAAAAGVKIGGILRMSDTGVQVGSVKLYGEQVRALAAADSSGALAPGQVTVRSQVQMVFWVD